MSSLAVVAGMGWVVAGGWVVDGALVVGGPGATAPAGRQMDLPGSSRVLTVALFTASRDFIVTLARLAIVDQASPETIV